MIPIFGDTETIPSEIADLHRTGVIEAEDCRLGIQLRYQRGALKTDVYLYDYGTFPQPQDIRSPQILEHFRECCSGVLALAGSDFYRDVHLSSCDAWQITHPDCPIQFLHAQFSLAANETEFSIDVGPQFSHLLLTTFGGYFLKIRSTFPEGGSSERLQDLEHFLIDLLSTLKAL